MADDGPPTMRGTIRIPHGIFKAMPEVIAVRAFASKLEYLLPDGTRQWLMHGAPASECSNQYPNPTLPYLSLTPHPTPPNPHPHPHPVTPAGRFFFRGEWHRGDELEVLYNYSMYLKLGLQPMNTM